MNTLERPKLVFTQEEIDNQFSSTMDSIKLINFLNSKTDKTQEEIESIERNKNHIIGFLKREYIVSDTRDKSVFENIIKDKNTLNGL